MSFMDSILARAGLTDIAEKVFAAQRLTDDEGLRLYAAKDLSALGYLANHVLSFPNSIWERNCRRNSIAQKDQRERRGSAMELPQQGRSQTEFGNEEGRQI